MPKAQCKICGIPLDTKTAYKIVLGYTPQGKERRAYYCSQEEYELDKTKKEQKKLEEKLKKEARGRKVKCKYCSKNMYTGEAAHVKEYKTKNFYFCSDECYNAHEKEAEDWYAVEAAINEIFGYEIENSAMNNEWQRWNHLANNGQIAEYITENKEYLCSMLAKDFKSEYAKIRYFSAILCNSLRDFVDGKRKQRAVIEPPKIQTNMEEMMYEIRNTNTNKRQSLEDWEDMF